MKKSSINSIAARAIVLIVYLALSEILFAGSAFAQAKTSSSSDIYFVGLTKEALAAFAPRNFGKGNSFQTEVFREASFFRQFGMLPLRKNTILDGVFLVRVVDRKQFSRFSESLRFARYVEPVDTGTSSSPREQTRPNYSQKRTSFVAAGEISTQAKAVALKSSVVAGSSLGVGALANNDPEDTNWGHDANTGANIRNAWDISTGDPSVIVAVLGTGIDFSHPDLVDNLWKDPNPDALNVKESVDGFNVFNDSNRTRPNDDSGWGTYASGIIGAKGNNFTGVAGVAWNIKLMPVRVGSRGATKSLINSDLAKLIEGMEYVIRKSDQGHKASIIYSHLNFTSPITLSPTMSAMIDAAASRNILFVTSAGSIPADINTHTSVPGHFTNPNLISVGSYGLDNGTIKFSVYSNWGNQRVHLAAPGEQVRSCWLTAEGSYYTNQSSTPLASAAYVAGVAALVKSKYPSSTYKEIKDRILNGVRSYPAQLADKVITGGVLDAANAIGSTAPVIPGDYDRSGVVDNADYQVWRANYGATGSNPADGNGDNSVDLADYVIWRNNLGKTNTPLAGDYDQNGTVDNNDYQVWRASYGNTGANLQADGNHDGIVDLADYVIWRDNFKSTVTPLAGDYDNNGIVDNADYQVWRANYGATGSNPADGNADGVVDSADYTIWRSNLGKTR